MAGKKLLRPSLGGLLVLGVSRNDAFYLALGGYRQYYATMTTFPELERITFDPDVMDGKPCIRGMRVTVGMILGLIASGAEREEILRLYPYLEPEDIWAALVPVCAGRGPTGREP